VSNESYPVDQVVKYVDASGEIFIGSVVPNIKLPGDICIRWNHDCELVASYDQDWLDKNAEKVYPETTYRVIT